MLFEPTVEDQEASLKLGYSKMYFFGGGVSDKQNAQQSQSPLYELHIVWSKMPQQ